MDNSSERLPIDPAKGEAGVAILTGYQAQQEGGDPDAAARAYIDAACEQYASEGGIG